MNQFIKKVTAITVAFTLLLCLVPAQPARATFPGYSGKLAYGYLDGDFDTMTLVDGIKDINLNGSGERTLQSSVLGFGGSAYYTTSPRYSADGQKLTFTLRNNDIPTSSDIVVTNADGTNLQNITNLIPADLPERENYKAVYSSFYPNGTQLAYGESWEQDINGPVGQIYRINTDGTGKVALTEFNQDHCDMYPVVSPDGNKIAFWRGDYSTETSGIYTMDADGSNQQELVQISGSSVKCYVNDIAMGQSGQTAFDWSPDGTKLVFNRVLEIENEDETTMIYQITTTDMAGNQEVVYELVTTQLYPSNPEDSPVTVTATRITSPQFTPEGGMIFKKFNGGFTSTYDPDTEDWNQSDWNVEVTLHHIHLGDDSPQTLMTLIFSEDPNLIYISMFNYTLPTIQPLSAPLPNNGNTTTLQNPEDGNPILLQTPENTTITCSSTLKESANTKQDETYQYPLGLVNFCFDTENQNNEVSLTFVTNLKPNEVTPRKYNSNNNTYFDIQGATITETTLEGQPALKLTYTITDNGQLDLDPATGKIKDPVGLAVTADDSLASTGSNTTLITFIALITTLGAGAVLKRRYNASS